MRHYIIARCYISLIWMHEEIITMVKVLFVCLGNICRSPSAEGVFRACVEKACLQDTIEIDSCGTAAYHIGKSPDPRSIAAAAKRGIDISQLQARQVQAADFHHFDYLMAMDESNLENLKRIQPSNSKAQVGLLMDFSPHPNQTEVPDPYYGGEDGFELVLDLLDEACSAFLDDIQKDHA